MIAVSRTTQASPLWQVPGERLQRHPLAGDLVDARRRRSRSSARRRRAAVCAPGSSRGSPRAGRRPALRSGAGSPSRSARRGGGRAGSPSGGRSSRCRSRPAWRRGRAATGRRRAEAGALAEVALAVGVVAVPAGVDEDDVAGADLAGGLEVGGLDQLPAALRRRRGRRRCRRSSAERQVGQVGAAGDQVDRRVDVGPGVEHGDDALGHHAVAGVRGAAADVDVLVAGEDRRVAAERVAEVDQRHPAARIGDPLLGRVGPEVSSGGRPVLVDEFVGQGHPLVGGSLHAHCSSLVGITTTKVVVRLVRLATSRSSPAGIQQESRGPSTASESPELTNSSPSRTR